MAKHRRDHGAQRLLEAWERPADAGEPVGCIATTFTFDSQFFEEHCLSRFLGLETDPREDGAAYLIEREEKLATVTVSVLVDRSNAQGSQSARWDVLPVSVPGAIQHAKVTVLAWERLVRILIGSANLTEPAHRKNQEVVGVLDFRDGGEAPVELLIQTLEFLGRLATLAPGSDTMPGPKARLGGLLTGLTERSRPWTGRLPKDSPRVVPVFLGPMPGYQQQVPERLGLLMRERGSPATDAWVLSPFFDQAGGDAYPGTTALLGALTDRGQRTVGFLVVAETLPDARLRLRAPASLLRSERKTAKYTVYPVEEDVDGEHRPLHAKSVWLWNDRWHVYMIGSSNFTGAGLGLPQRQPNVEANLAYIFQDDGPIVRTMEDTLPRYGEEIEHPDAVLWEPLDEEAGESTAGQPVLPAAFDEALFNPEGDGGTLTLRFLEKGMPDEWDIKVPGSSGAEPGGLFSSRAWREAGSPAKLDLTWRSRFVPTALQVHWRLPSGEAMTATWPVNVTDPRSLPPPEDLRNLSLDTLVEILGSGRPLHEAVLAAKRQIGEPASGTDALSAESDPHRRVRTETFLLQRTRRVARAVEQLVTRLGRPVAHRDALAWRLRGPVGPLALGRAIGEGARSPGEAAFLLADLALALRRLDPRAIGAGVPEDEVRRELQAVIGAVEDLVRSRMVDEAAVPLAMRQYVARALEEVHR